MKMKTSKSARQSTSNERTKFPRIPHIPWSPGATSDDRMLDTIDHFLHSPLIVTEKLDGECTMMSCDKMHARSEEACSRPWQSYIRALHGRLQYLFPENFRIYGENMYAIHTITYEQLTAYFYIFNIVENGMFVSWKTLTEHCKRFDFCHVPIIACLEAQYHVDTLRHSLQNIEDTMKSKLGSTIEGYVVRTATAFPISEFGINTAKWVRENHVQTDEHWTKNWEQASLI